MITGEGWSKNSFRLFFFCCFRMGGLDIITELVYAN